MSNHPENFGQLCTSIANLMTRDMKEDVLMSAGVSPGRAMTLGQGSNSSFWAELAMLGKFSSNNLNTNLWKGYPGIVSLITSFSKGGPMATAQPVDNGGKASVELDINPKLIEAPKTLTDALNHPDFKPIFAKLFLDLNDINPMNNNTGWQNLMHSFLPIKFPHDLRIKLFSNNCKNPSEDLVTYVANYTDTSLTRFCEIIESYDISIAKYAEKLRNAYKKSAEKFDHTANQVKNDMIEITSWCNQQGLQRLIPIFDEQGIDTLDVIKKLTENDLEKLGIKAMGDRKKVMGYIEELNRKAQIAQ